jgi:hypothetical protein
MPVFMFIGYAGPYDPNFLNITIDTVYIQAVQEYKAFMVGVEVRYYGDSLNWDMLSESFKYCYCGI